MSNGRSETPSMYLERMVVDGKNREQWLRARDGKIGGSDAANYSKLESAPLYIRSKLADQFRGNAYTEHGNDRERAILRRYGVEQNTALFHAEGNPRHVATPDGIATRSGEFALVQVKTSTKALSKTTPRAYLRQIWWEQYVMGAEVTLLLWEQHDGDFAPLDMDPESRVIYRDDTEISALIVIADRVLDGMDRAEAFRKELTQ